MNFAVVERGSDDHYTVAEFLWEADALDFREMMECQHPHLMYSIVRLP